MRLYLTKIVFNQKSHHVTSLSKTKHPTAMYIQNMQIYAQWHAVKSDCPPIKKM